MPHLQGGGARRTQTFAATQTCLGLFPLFPPLKVASRRRAPRQSRWICPRFAPRLKLKGELPRVEKLNYLHATIGGIPRPVVRAYGGAAFSEGQNEMLLRKKKVSKKGGQHGIQANHYLET